MLYLLAVGAVLGWYKKWKRNRRRGEPFPEAWVSYLKKNVPFYDGLPEDLRREFHHLVLCFVREKHFIEAGGMEITDEVRVVVAAAAVRLVLHLDLSYYDRLTEIVVYPHDYRHPDREGVILGEAHSWGTVVLSWPAVLGGLGDPRDGLDTATHEFAHVLDNADGVFDGTPQLRAHDDYRPWSRIMAGHYERMEDHRSAARKVLRAYGMENEVEFFAVATEAFFEKPRQMRKRTPDLYEELRRFYGFDPASDGHDGVPSGTRVGRNAPCPCGSGVKYKRCCGRPW